MTGQKVAELVSAIVGVRILECETIDTHELCGGSGSPGPRSGGTPASTGSGSGSSGTDAGSGGGEAGSQGPTGGGAGNGTLNPEPDPAQTGSVGGAGNGNPAGGGIWNELKYKTVPVPGHSNQLTRVWSLTHNSGPGGWIVQHVQIQDPQGHVLYNYWEGWKVAPNSHFAIPSAAGANDYFGGPTGTRFNAQARFYEGSTAPASWDRGWMHANTYPAHDLRAVGSNPNLPTNQATRANRIYWVAP